MLRHLGSLGLMTLAATAYLGATTSAALACSPLEGPYFSAPLPGQTVGPDASISVGVALGKALTFEDVRDSIRLLASDGTPVPMTLQGMHAQDGIAFLVGAPLEPLPTGDYTLDAGSGLSFETGIVTDTNAEPTPFTVTSTASSAALAAPNVTWSRVRFAGEGSPLPGSCDNGSGIERHSLELNYPDAQDALGVWYGVSFAMDDGSTLVRYAMPAQVYDSPTARTTIWTPANTSCVTVTPFAVDAQPGPPTVLCEPQACSSHPAGTYSESTATSVDCSGDDDGGCAASGPADALPLGSVVLVMVIWGLRRRR